MWPPSIETMEAYYKLDSKQKKENFLKTHIFPQERFKNLSGIRPVLMECMLKFGIDPKKNPFLSFAMKIPFPMKESKLYRDKMQYIFDSYKNNKMDLSMPALLNPSLYSRKFDEFQYTLNAFHIMSDPKKAGCYLKDTSVADVSEFMSGNEIKPAGLNGEEGDTIFNVIERWAKDNEYSPEEIADKKEKAEKEAEDSKDKKNGTDINININGENGSNGTQWNYDYFKEILEKVFANSGKFETTGNKNEYLEKAFVTFSLPEITPQSTDNKLYKKTFTEIKDADVNKFGNPHEIDEPIHITVRTGSKTVPGIYVFHKFIPIDETSLSHYKQLANKNLGNLKRHLNNVNPNNDNDVDTHLQRIITALDGLSGITSK